MATRDGTDYLDVHHFVVTHISSCLHNRSDMGVLKVPSLLRLLFLMLLLLAPGSHAKTCKEASKTYTTVSCRDDPCAEACHKEGFTDGRCYLIDNYPIEKLCYCDKEC